MCILVLTAGAAHGAATRAALPAVHAAGVPTTTDAPAAAVHTTTGATDHHDATRTQQPTPARLPPAPPAHRGTTQTAPSHVPGTCSIFTL